MAKLGGSALGFTLLELMIALTVLTFGLLAVAAMSTIVIRGSETSNKLSIATTLAQDKLEKLKAATYSSIASETCSGPSWVTSCGVTVTADSPTTDMKTIGVTVTWTDTGYSGGRDHSVTLTTLRSK